LGGWIGVAPLVCAALVAATTNVYAAGVADLAVTKSGPATAVQNTAFNYHIAVTNNGPDPATNVTLTDRLPAAVSFGDVVQDVPGPPSTCLFSFSTSTLTCTVPTLNAFVTAGYMVLVGVSSSIPNGTLISNTASASSNSTSDPDLTNNSATVGTTVQGADTDLAISPGVSPAPVQATSAAGAAVTFTIPAAVDGALPAPVVCSPASGSIFPVGSTTVTCSATDPDDTPSTVQTTLTVTVFDTDLAITAGVSPDPVQATSAAGAAVTFTTPTASDEEGPVSVVCDQPSGSTFPVGTTLVTCTATDPDDTPSTVHTTLTITVIDTDLAITAGVSPAPVQATSAAGAVVNFTQPTASDEEESVSVVCDHPSGSTFPVGTTLVTCTATDLDDTPSTVQTTLTITVIDTDLAITAGVSPAPVQATSAAGAAVTFTTPTASDEEGPVAVTCDHASGDTFPVGTTTVTCTATDPDDTPSTVQTTLTITVIDTDLAITAGVSPAPVQATSAAGAAVTFTIPTASDEDGPVAVTCDHASGSIFPVGTTAVTCTATDADDTPSTVQTTITVTVTFVDTDLALTGVPADIVVDATSPDGAVVTYTPPTATDEETPPEVTCDMPSGSTFPIGTTTVTCTATDPDDDPSTVSAAFDVTVNGAGPQLDALLAYVDPLPPGSSLSSKAQSAISSFDAGDIAGTCSNLSALINKANNQAGKQLTQDQATTIVRMASQIQAVIGC
jgi:uncharacterized repeat protein (TIGR01451 family)